MPTPSAVPRTSSRQLDWMTTYTGRKFYPEAPELTEPDIEDIAHALSMQCRFGGHTKEFYSVAQHSVLVSEFVEQHQPQFALWGLMHDASEAYLVDLPRPIKYNTLLGAEYKELEAKVTLTICHTFGLEEEEPPIVKEADRVLLFTEMRDFMDRKPKKEDFFKPLPVKLLSWSQSAAKALFLQRFTELTVRVI